MEYCDDCDSCALDKCPLWYDETINECDLDNADFVNKYYPVMFGGKVDPSNAVDHPSHYNQGDIECIDAMVSAFGKEAVENFCIVNAFKYVWRSKSKNGFEDIDKAIWYLNKVKELIND